MLTCARAFDVTNRSPCGPHPMAAARARQADTPRNRRIRQTDYHSDLQHARVDRHADDGVGADGGERIDFRHRTDAAGRDEVARGECAQPRDSVEIDALLRALGFYERAEERPRKWFEG